MIMLDTGSEDVRDAAPPGSFRALRISQSKSGEVSGVATRLVTMRPDALTAGEVTLGVRYSSVNYKDALAATGRGRILRATELNGGIDVAGVVTASASSEFAPGDEVFACGAGLSETLDGGYAEVARLPAAILRRPPAPLSLRDCMALGTAGITAAIALERLIVNGQPRDRGPIVVTGASGGVGSVAVHLLSRLGFEVTASTGKAGAEDYLHSLGADQVVDRAAITGDGAPRALEPGRWGGAIDSVGGNTLAWLAATVRPWGNVASIGLAGGAEYTSSVMPLILRGTSLLGVNCIELPADMLDRCWGRLAELMTPDVLATMAPHVATLDTLMPVFDATLAAELIGRTVVEIG